MRPRTNLNAKVNQNYLVTLNGRTVDRQTDGHHQSISRNCFAIRPKTRCPQTSQFREQQDVFVKQRCPRKQQRIFQAKTYMSYILTLPHPKRQVTLVRCKSNFGYCIPSLDIAVYVSSGPIRSGE